VVNKNSGSDTLKIQCAPIGKKTVYCKTIDGLGRKSMDSTFVNIVQDKPVITFLSPDQTINFGGMAQCSIAVSHQFGPCTLRVHLKGNASPEIKRVGLGFDSSFSTGAALTWDSVKIKISDSHGNSIDTGFSITIIPPTPSDQWIEYASMNGHHRLHASEAINGTLYAIGGCMAQWVGSGTNNTVPVKTVEAYDTLLKTWTIKDSLLNARYDFATCAHGGQIYAVGGIGKKEYVSVMEQYDPLGDKWTIFDTMQVGTNQFTRAGSASCLVGNKLYLFGGKTPLDLQGYDSVCQTIYVYDFTSKNWSETIHMLMPRYDFQAIQINGKIYLIGGLDADDMPLQSIEIFDPNAGTCTPGPSMSSGLSNFAAAAVGGKLYLIGGINSASNLILNSLNMFDPAANAWSSRASLPQPRHSMSACVINGTIYVTGGINNFDPALDETTDKVLMKYFP
jgi:Kelch motif.